MGWAIQAKNVNWNAKKWKRPPKSSKIKMFVFGLRSTSHDRPIWSMDLNPICHPSPANKMKCSFLNYVQLQMIDWAIQGKNVNRNAKKWKRPPKSSKNKSLVLDYIQLLMISRGIWAKNVNQNAKKWKRPPKSSKNKMFIFGLCSTPDDWRSWSMDSNPICHPSPAKKMKCSFLDYVQLLMIGWAGQWTWTPSAIPLQPKKWNARFWIMFNFWWSAGLVDGLEPHLAPISSQNNEMLIFGLRSTSDDLPGWLKDSNPVYHASPTKEMKCSFLDYVQLLMTGRAGRWTRTPSATPLQPKRWNAHFWITFNFWWSAEWSKQKMSTKRQKNEKGPLSHQKIKCSFLGYVQLLMMGQTGRWTRTPSATPLQPKRWNAHFMITFNFWWSAGLVNGLEPHLPLLSSQKNEMLIFGLCSTSDDQ